jgi:hypothetical protein
MTHKLSNHFTITIKLLKLGLDGLMSWPIHHKMHLISLAHATSIMLAIESLSTKRSVDGGGLLLGAHLMLTRVMCS